ncbi:MAG: cytochrome c biogenesis protein CcdA [Planctomycetota bacterium]
MRALPRLSFLCAFAVAALLPAQDGTLTLKAAFEPATAKPGEQVVLVLSASVTEGWHAYGTLETTNTPVALAPEKVVAGGLELAGPAQIPPGMPKMLGSLRTFPLPNEFTVRQAMKVPAGMAAGAVEVQGKLDFGICNDSGCLPPDEAAFTATLTVVAGNGVAGVAPPPAADRDRGPKPGLRVEPGPGSKPAVSGDKVRIAAAFQPATVRAGEVSVLVLTVDVVAKEYHAYGALESTNKPVRLDRTKIDAGDLELVGDAFVPPGEQKMVGPLATYPLPHRFEVKQAVRVPAGVKPATIDVSGALDYQICTATFCDPETVIDFETKLVVEAGAARAEATVVPVFTAPVDAGGGSNPFGGWWALILACIGGGLFALAMPCTYPMIPITFSFFTKQAEKRGGNVLPLAVTYALGIVLMFTAIGAAVAFASGVVDDQTIIALANHWLLNSVIGIVFLVFAFVLFGWINIQPPQFLQNAAGKASASGGYLGVFFMGATLVITSFTCTAPIVGSLLASVITAGKAPVIVGMSVFGLTMALPFLALSLAPTRVKALPRSGEWMETVKVSLGFVELAATLKFVSLVDVALDWNLLPRELFLLLCAAIFVLWALYLFGILRKAGTLNEGVGAGRMATGMFVVLLATYLFFGGLGYKLDFYMTAFAPPYSARMVGARAEAPGAGKSLAHTIVKDDGDRALEVAKAEDKLLLYNFTGFN